MKPDNYGTNERVFLTACKSHRLHHPGWKTPQSKVPRLQNTPTIIPPILYHPLAKRLREMSVNGTWAFRLTAAHLRIVLPWYLTRGVPPPTLRRPAFTPHLLVIAQVTHLIPSNSIIVHWLTSRIDLSLVSLLLSYSTIPQSRARNKRIR